MTQPITIADYFEMDDPVPIIDVRTPAEFAKGHIPGAFNLPLFSDEERIKVGTTYKQQSREAAILLAFDLAGPKWSGYIQQALQIAPGKRVAVHCWRGGMRSGAMAWALDLYGFKVYVIKGGYKQYRSFTREIFAAPYMICLLGGMTGSGKTSLLHELKKRDEQVIDLEALAAHKGSAYGSMNMVQSPSQEQFENNLAQALYQLNSLEPVWIEDECRLIGRCSIPESLWQQMKNSNLVYWQVPKEERVEHLVKEYGVLDKHFLIDSTIRISKRLGPKETKDAIAAIREDRMSDFINIALVYYDKTYTKGLEKRLPETIFPVEAQGDIASCASKIREFVQSIFTKTNNLS